MTVWLLSRDHGEVEVARRRRVLCPPLQDPPVTVCLLSGDHREELKYRGLSPARNNTTKKNELVYGDCESCIKVSITSKQTHNNTASKSALLLKETSSLSSFSYY